jgi:hypothetical protein
MSVIVKNFKFELPEGPKTKVNLDIVNTAMQRPTVEGQPRCQVPMHITRVECRMLRLLYIIVYLPTSRLRFITFIEIIQ